MPRQKSEGKLVLQAHCAKRKIAQSGSVMQLLERLDKYEKKKMLEAGYAKDVAQIERDEKRDKKAAKNAVKDAKRKKDAVDGMLQMSTNISSFKKPLTIKAKEYIDTYCDGKLENAQPQWVLGSGKDAESLLKIPEVRGSKVGPNIRWVMYKGLTSQ